MRKSAIDKNAPILVEFAPTRGGGAKASVKPGTKKATTLTRGAKISIKPSDLAEQSAQALDSAMNTIHNMARRVTDTIKNLDVKPTQVEVEFGITLDAEAGALIAKAGIEAAFNVALTWEFKDKK